MKKHLIYEIFFLIMLVSCINTKPEERIKKIYNYDHSEINFNYSITKITKNYNPGEGWNPAFRIEDNYKIVKYIKDRFDVKKNKLYLKFALKKSSKIDLIFKLNDDILRVTDSLQLLNKIDSITVEYQYDINDVFFKLPAPPTH